MNAALGSLHAVLSAGPVGVLGAGVIVPEHAPADGAEDLHVTEMGIVRRAPGAVLQPAMKGPPE
jgi:hypothetical protein